MITITLGSTSVTLDAGGNKIGEMKYYPFGETRDVSGTLGTDFHFTGQREESGLGSLYDYNARFRAAPRSEAKWALPCAGPLHQPGYDCAGWEESAGA